VLIVRERLLDAQSLINAARWSGAYYLSGYVLECALKPSVLRYIKETGIIFEDKRFAEKCWTHDLEVLVKLADLDAKRSIAISGNVQLGTNWLIAKDWDESSRYRISTQQQAQSLYNAVSETTNGVLQWIKQYW